MFMKSGISTLLKPRDPVRMVVWGYATYMIIGWLFLCMPFSVTGAPAGAIDHLFTAVSAVSTTGLITVSTPDTYSRCGQIAIAVLIQFGGLGYMTIGSFLLLSFGRRLAMVRNRVSQVALSAPEGVPIQNFVRSIVVFTLLIEAVGAVALYSILSARGMQDAWWSATFHSISAFCTAGFALYNDSFMAFRGNVWLNVTIASLSYLGAMGFILLNDVVQRAMRHKIRLSLSSRVILWCTLLTGVMATALLVADEPSLRDLPIGERILAAFFQSMSAGTTVGFNTVDIAGLSAGSVFLITIVMIIGASPAGTGGGIKTTTLAALWANMISVFKGRDRTNFGDRELPLERVRLAMASAMFYLVVLTAGIYALSLVESSPLPDQMFECASAIGTVGLSRGITPNLTFVGKCIIILLMFAGRVGPLALALTLLRPSQRLPEFYYPREDIAI